MSIHRDLWVTIPGVGQDRINAAYYLGGPAKTIETVKGTFGVDLNKYVGVGFARFPGIIDRLGGVYVDVDRQYTDTPWWKFGLAPGYQLLNIDGKSVVVPDQAMLAQAVTEFLTPPADDPAASGPTLLVAATTAAAAPDPGVAGPILDLAKWQAAQRSVPFTLLAPTYLPKGFTYAGKVPAGDGTYGIRVEGEMRPAVRMMYWYRGNLYLGISATTWTDAPLAGDGMVIQDNGTAYTLVGTLGTPDHVWWVKDKILYWVSDTLTYDVGQEDLLAVARSMRAVPVSGAVK